MKHIRMHYLLVLILSLSFFSACSDDKEEVLEPSKELIKHVDILGNYELQNLSASSLLRETNRELWSIRVKNIKIGSGKLQAYTYKNNILTVGDKKYEFSISKETDDAFEIASINGDEKVTFSLVKTDRNDGDDDGEIGKEEILGLFKVVEAYSYESGDEPAVNNSLIDKIWDIQDDKISINCAAEAVEYTYADNTITSAGVDYQIEKEGSQFIVTYLIGNTITAVHLEVTTDTCPEEEKPQVGDVELDKMYGYAAMAGTTGGADAAKENIHHFDNGFQFQSWLKAREKAKSKVPAIVWLSGEFTKEQGRGSGSPWFDIKRTENITIYGTNGFRMKNVGFFLNETSNIIIRNVYIEMPKADNGADGISMQKSSKIWVDHCTFESMNSTKDFEDGSCDITHGTTDVTVSWNHFIATQKTSLVGHSNNENQRAEDSKITATYHHNFFDKSNSRHPRVRFGTVHVFNNFYNAVSTYGAGSACSAMVLVESNYFDKVHLPTDICTYPAKPKGNGWTSNLVGDEAGFLFEAKNHYVNKPSNASDPYPFTNIEYKKYDGEKLATPLTRADFTPSYTYVVDKVEEIVDIVPSGAGVGKLPNYENAPLAIDNGNMPDPGEGGEEPGEGGEEPGEGTDLGNDWLALNLGAANGSASIVSEGNGISISGGGKFEGGKQEFFYVYREVAGDFVITARVDAFETTGNSNQAQGGLLFTPDVTKTANDFLHGGVALGGSKNVDESGNLLPAYYYTQRLSNVNAKRGGMTAPSSAGGETYLRLERAGDKCTVSYSLDGGATYGIERSDAFAAALPNKVYVGFHVSGGNGQSSAKFSDIKINGASVGFED